MNTCVRRIFKEQYQNDLELHLLCDAFTAAFSNQRGQSSRFEPAPKHYADSSANKSVMQSVMWRSGRSAKGSMSLREFRPTRMAFQYGASSGNLSLWSITWPRESSISCVIVNIQKLSGFHRQLPIWLSRGSLTSSWAEVTPNGRYMDFTSAMIMRRISLHTWSPFASLPVVFFTGERE